MKDKFGLEISSMPEQTWRYVDRTGWLPGPWEREPDKVIWLSFGLPCMVLRGPMGAFCGYVGVRKDHPLFAKGYDERVQRPADFDSRTAEKAGIVDIMLEALRPEPDGTVRLSLALAVHGGLTYAGEHTPLSKEAYIKWKDRFLGRQDKLLLEAATYPQGAAAKYLVRWAEAADSFVIWKTICETTTLSFPLDEPLWIFGFDCSHAGDASPQRNSYAEDVYRNLAYVKADVEALAKQLSSWKK